ncbi:MAG: ABC transporter permease [Clostridia bacterium]|nr:ABC transporter permease [Clostridia bacterium]
MKPLSAVNYIKNNLSGIMPSFVSVLLSVILVYSITAVIQQFITYANCSYINPFKNFTYAAPARSSGLSDNVIALILKNDSVGRIYPTQCAWINIWHILTKEEAKIYSLREESISSMMELLDLKVAKGRLPSDGRNEIILHWRIAANNNLKIGDTIKKSDISNSQALVGYTVVGTFDGEHYTGFYTLRDFKLPDSKLYKNGLLLVPKKGELSRLNEFLYSIAPSEIQLDSIDIGIDGTSFFICFANMIIIMVLSTILIVLCILLANINYIQYYKRRKEFSLLYAIGYSRKEILLRYLRENVLICSGGYITGVLFSLFGIQIFNIIVWLPLGLDLPLWSTFHFSLTILIPIAVTIASIIPAVKMLKKIEAISILEGK